MEHGERPRKASTTTTAAQAETARGLLRDCLRFLRETTTDEFQRGADRELRVRLGAFLGDPEA